MDFGEDDEQLESAENSPENSPEGMTLAERLSKKVKAEPGLCFSMVKASSYHL